MTRYFYDADDRLSKTIDANGNTTSTTYSPTGQPATRTDANGRVTRYFYDADDRLIQTIDPAGHTTSRTYNGNGRVITSTDALGRVTQYAYDGDGNLTSTIDPLGHTSSKTYTATGQVATSTNARGGVMQYFYDAGDRLLQTIDPDGNTAFTTTYLAGGQVATSTDADGGVTQYFYDADDRLIRTIDPIGRITLTGYDAADRIASSTEANGALTTREYDANGNLTALVDPLGNRTTYGYDEAGNQISVTDPLGHSAVFSFDLNGRMTSTTDRDGRRRYFVYDAAGQLLKETWLAANGTVVDIQIYSYGADGNIVTARNSNGTYTFAYDAAGQVLTVAEPFGVMLAFSYDAGGNRRQVADSFGGLETSSYDATNQLSSRTFSKNGQAVIHVEETYNGRGLVVQQGRFAANNPVLQVGTSNYAYSPAGRITGLSHRDAAGNTLAAYLYTFDNAGQLTAKTDHGITTQYSYDSAGQLTAVGTNTHSYDGNGNPSAAGNIVGAGNLLLSDGTYNYGYDAEGNQTGKTNIATGEQWTYGYDNKNHMVSAGERTSAGALELQAYYQYDVFGNRIQKNVWTQATGTIATKFALDGWNPAKGSGVGNENWDVWADIDGSGSLTTRYVRGDVVDKVFARVGQSGSTPYWYLTDNQGSIRDLIDNSGVVRDSITYDAFGNITAETDASSRGRYAWTGRELDVETGLQYNRARYYDAGSGRWLSQDPLGFAAGDSNLYRYIHNKPIFGTDPSGLQGVPANGPRSFVPIVNPPPIGSSGDPRRWGGNALTGTGGYGGFGGQGSGPTGWPPGQGTGQIYGLTVTGGYGGFGGQGGTGTTRPFGGGGGVSNARVVQIAFGVLQLLGGVIQIGLGVANAEFGGLLLAAHGADDVSTGWDRIRGIDRQTATGQLINIALQAVGFDSAGARQISDGMEFAGTLGLSARVVAGRAAAAAARPTHAPVRVAPDLTRVPSVSGAQFQRWFNSLTAEEINQVWRTPSLRNAVEARLRSPGGFHEWLPVSRAPKFREWGITVEQIQQWRTATNQVRFRTPPAPAGGAHGGAGSTTFHNRILELADAAPDFASFRTRLQTLANEGLEGGAQALPPGLRP